MADDITNLAAADTTWRERLRYRSDTLLARGSTGPLIWLGVAALALTVVGALVFWAFGFEWGDRKGAGESFWQSFVIAIGKGVLPDGGWSQRLVSLFFIFASLFLAGSLVGLLVAAINRRLDVLRRGRSRVLERGHTVVLGNSGRLMAVLDELLAYKADTAAIVVLSEADKATMEDTFLARNRNPARRVVFRTGVASRLADLEMVAIRHAKSVIVLNEGSTVDAVAVRRALAANSFSPADVHVVTEMAYKRISRSLAESTGGQIATVCVDAMVADMMAQAIRSPGLAEVFSEMLSFEGDELYVLAADSVPGGRWADLVCAFADVTPVGLLPHGATSPRAVELLPSPDRVVVPGDRLLVLATGPEPPTRGFRGASPGFSAWPSDHDVERVMVLGWSRLGHSMVENLMGFLPPGAAVRVYADENMVPGGFPEAHSFDRYVHFEHTNHDPDEIMREIRLHEPDVLVVLGYMNAVAEDEADALTLLTLLTLDGRADELERRPRVVAQLLNNELGALAAISGADDFVVTDAVVSHMLVHLSRDRALAPAFDDLFDADGPAFWPMSIEPGTYRFGDLGPAFAEAGMVLVGVRTAAGVNLNPTKDEEMTLGADDRLLVLSRTT